MSGQGVEDVVDGMEETLGSTYCSVIRKTSVAVGPSSAPAVRYDTVGFRGDTAFT